MGKIVSIKDFKARQAERRGQIEAEKALVPKAWKDNRQFRNKWGGVGGKMLSTGGSQFPAFFIRMVPHMVNTMDKFNLEVGGVLKKIKERDINSVGTINKDLYQAAKNSYHEVEPIMKHLDDIHYSRNGQENLLDPVCHKGVVEQIEELWNGIQEIFKDTVMSGPVDVSVPEDLACISAALKVRLGDEFLTPPLGKYSFASYTGVLAGREALGGKLRDICKAFMFMELINLQFQYCNSSKPAQYGLFLELAKAPEFQAMGEYRMIAYACFFRRKSDGKEARAFSFMHTNALEDSGDAPYFIASIEKSIEDCGHEVIKVSSTPLDQVLPLHQEWKKKGYKTM